MIDPESTSAFWLSVQTALFTTAFFYVSGHAIADLRKERQKYAQLPPKPKKPIRGAMRWAVHIVCAAGYALLYLSETLTHAQAVGSAIGIR
ncbi:hypothetical protein [Phenylobacterium sp.]|uniref:hypothetical protein n=1 Tax=Phenylobacterium sp. TaxID=1871053 RepID=UPI003BA98F2C